MSKFSSFAIVLLALIVFGSCRTTTVDSDEAVTIHGRVMLDNYVNMTPPYDGITASLENTSISAVTDSNGYYILKNVPTGTYNLHLSKPGYGYLRWFSMTVAGGGGSDLYWYTEPNGWPSLHRTSTMVTTLQHIVYVDTGTDSYSHPTCIFANGTFTPDSTYTKGYETIVLFVSHTSDVSSQPGKYLTYFYYNNELIGVFNYGTGGQYIPNVFDNVNRTFSFGIPKDLLHELNFNSGDSIYFAAYGAHPYGASTSPSPGDYWDPTIQNEVCTSINQTPSPVIGSVMP